MSCLNDAELEDYVDDALESGPRTRVETHLDECASCRADVERLRRLLLAARGLRQDESPPRDLWPQIEARLGRRPASPAGWRPSWISLAAAALLLVALTWMVAGRDRGVSPLGETVRPTVASVDAEGDLDRAAERARVEGGLMHVRVDLLRSLAERENRIDPATRELVAQNLAIIDRAVGEISTARRQNPENPALGKLLATTYQREAALLKQINRL